MTDPEGRPIGPYQGAYGMSGEATSGTDIPEPLKDGKFFLGGTAGPAIAPQQT